MDVKKEIEMHQDKKDQLEADIPSFIVIGPFWINCDTVRTFLVKKRKELAKAVLELLAKKLRDQTEEVIHFFNSMAFTPSPLDPYLYILFNKLVFLDSF